MRRSRSQAKDGLRAAGEESFGTGAHGRASGVDIVNKQDDAVGDKIGVSRKGFLDIDSSFGSTHCHLRLGAAFAAKGIRHTGD